ncbi:TRAP transporter small permease [Corticibacter populi]|uniref:TRAP transporter small permease protein n=1 Tax=Corticibacter populi TaxID=1550736 RepID=A0A3M6QUL5_9BURK|nr:TRAP transporter small permease [Corticibacter populi]RMX06653.1 TRAP transporter small permease [Corticibacter populi]RZS31773.1 TRAP-type C4-dicarboxylate transport system permease small subunit [Corticibacter populi]
MSALSAIHAIDRALAFVERCLLVAIAAGMTGLMMLQVILRYFFNAPLFWAEEVSVQLLVFMTLFGISLLIHHGQLVNINFLPQMLGRRGQLALNLLSALAMLAILLLLAWLGWQWVARADVRLEMGATTQLPRWYNYSALPLAAAAMCWHQFAAMLRLLPSRPQEARAC